MGEYARAIRARARDGVASHGTLGAYIRDFRASSKLFEMVVAERMAREHGRAFWLWEDVALEVKDARGLPHPDTGIDVTDAETTIVQCKLRAATLAWAECATWSTRLAELVAFHAEHGRLPPASTRGLGGWVQSQRRARATMAPERKARLEELEWWVWTVRAA